MHPGERGRFSSAICDSFNSVLLILQDGRVIVVGYPQFRFIPQILIRRDLQDVMVVQRRPLRLEGARIQRGCGSGGNGCVVQARVEEYRG